MQTTDRRPARSALVVLLALAVLLSPARADAAGPERARERSMLLISGLSAHAERVADADDGPGSDEQLDTDDDSDGGDSEDGDSEDGDSEDGDSEDGDSEDGDSGGGDATVTPPNDPIDPASAVLAVVGFGILAGLAGWWMVRRRSPDDQPFPQSDDEQWPPETML